MNHHLFSRIIFVALAALVLNCSNKKQPAETEKPNILWIYLEDTSPLLSCYGSKLNPTPHIDRLAEQGIRFTRAFMPAPVCSATRSGIITGTMPTTFGLHNHHSSRTESSAIYLPDSVKTIPELFRKQGYFTLNNGKDDYNFMYDRRDLYSQDYEMHPFYGKRGARVDLASLKGREPFFVQIQLSGGKEIFSSGFKDNVEEPADREKIVLPPYLQPTYMDVDGVEFVKVMKELYRNNELDSIQARFVSDYRPAEELYDLNEDPHEINNLAGDPEYADLLQKHRGILDNWIKETRDQGQYPEKEEGLRLMLGIWGKHANNPEYDPLREKYPNLEDSLWELKSAGWEKPAGQY